METAICCPQFDPTPWNEKAVIWENKKFIKEKVFTFFFMPINFGKVMKKMDEQVRNAGGRIPDWLCLSDHTSKWNMDVYLAVDKDIPGAENAVLQGKFLSKVYEGPYKDIGKWCKDFEAFAKTREVNIKKLFMWYTTCPKCAKKYGHNYVVIMAQIG